MLKVAEMSNYQHFETAGSFFLKIFIWENFANMCNVTETWKICYKNYRSFHNFLQKRSSKLRKWVIVNILKEWQVSLQEFWDDKILSARVSWQELSEYAIKTVGLFISFMTNNAQSYGNK